MYLDKQIVAFVVVGLDVVIAIVLYFGFQHRKAMQLLTNQDSNDTVVMAQDFSVMMVGLPAHDSVNELRAEMWDWVE